MSKITYIFKKFKFQILFHNNIHTYKHQIYEYIFNPSAEERKERQFLQMECVSLQVYKCA